MQIDIITIFPELFTSFLKESLLYKAQEKGLLKIKIHNLRDFVSDRKVDDKPFGGGRGMVMKADVIQKAVKKIKKKNGKVILFSPRGKKFNQKKATSFSKVKQLVLISGRYEGIDERVAKHIADEVISIGDYVLMGGDLPCLVVIESVARLIPNVIGKPELVKRRIKKAGFVEYPQYTRPEIVEIKGKKIKAPKVLLSGNHKDIEEWREKNSVVIE